MIGTFPESSTAELEIRPPRGGLVLSTSTEQMARGVYTVPQSAQTLTTSCGTLLGPFAWGEALDTIVLGKHIPHAERVAEFVTHQDSADTDSLPTRRVVVEWPRPTAPFRSADWLSESLGVAGELSLPAVMRVASLDTAARASRRPSLRNSTDVVLGVPSLVESKLSEATALAAGEWFEDGVESKFCRTLSSLLYGYGVPTVAAVEKFVRSPSSNIEIAVEAAQWLGEVDHAASQRYRRTFLESLLGSASARLRHGAAAGLASMDDPSSLPAVREALNHESNRRLRNFLELVVDQLERTRACLNT